MRCEIIPSSEHLRPYRWRLVTDEGQIVAAGPACADLAACHEGISLVQAAAAGAEGCDLTAAEDPSLDG